MKTASQKRAATFELGEAGQSPWLDSISRELLNSGRLKRLVKDYGLLGVTSNPSIFEKAISTPGAGYDKDVSRLLRKKASTLEIYDALTIADIQSACDQLEDVYCASFGEHGYVSLEVTPDLAHEEAKTVEEGARLFNTVAKPNVMIKVPATPEGVKAFRELTARGINVNVTLIFSRRQYLDVLNAYLEGLTECLKRGGDISDVHSVASVFVSRFDTFIDGRLAQLEERDTDAKERRDIKSLYGKAAIANSKVIYDEFKKVLSSEKWKSIAAKGGNVQKVLWGSTSVKSPKYPDLMYVETLVGRETVNTMPQATLDAVLDHGNIRPDTIEENVEEARATIEHLQEWGIDLEEVGSKLQHDGLFAFMKSFDSLMATIEQMRVSGKRKLTTVKTRYKISKKIQDSLPLSIMEKEKFLERFFKKDPTLWKTDDEHIKVINNRLGWLTIPDAILGRLYELDVLADEVRREKYKDLVLLGMGGSSLAPEVMSLISKRSSRKPAFHVVDTTDPGTILDLTKKVDFKKTLFLVSSKSGSTVETLSQYRYFYDKVLKTYGKKKEAAVLAGAHFVAVTDDGSRLEQEGYDKHFRRVFINPTDIGGRYSALSMFGLVPAALLGIDVREVISGARELYEDTRAAAKLKNNDAVYLGALLGVLAENGQDKLTVWSTKSLSSFGAWLEQLIAESTGKEGKGVIPVDGEAPAVPAKYGKDRVFLVLKLRGESDEKLNQRVQAVKKAGFPVIEMDWPGTHVLGAEFLRWEIVTSVTSAVMNIDPFDEPNVKESKDNTMRLLSIAEKEGSLPEPKQVFSARKSVPVDRLFETMPEGGYVALLAYIGRNPKTAKALAKVQAKLRDVSGVPVLAGFGPRYLHSIGQLYKGGPDKGSFVVFMMNDPKDAAIPDAKFSFSVLKKAQAIGDAQAAETRNRPLLVVDLGRDAEAGLESFLKQVSAAKK